eukprot:scaffold120601_cov51-Attheya_sp.AAC.3
MSSPRTSQWTVDASYCHNISLDDTSRSSDEKELQSSRTSLSKSCNGDAGGTIEYREVEPRDKEQIRALHDEWFPVKYKDDFYDELVFHRMAGSGEPLFSCVAAIRKDDTDTSDRSEENNKLMLEEKHESWDQVLANIGIRFENRGNVSPDSQRSGQDMMIENLSEDFYVDQSERGYMKDQDQIIGCVTGTFIESNRCFKETAELLVPDPDRHRRMFYIMTLGTITEYRKNGLATSLMKRCIEKIEQDPECGVIYLHVITYNKAAIRFYEKLGFYMVQEIKGNRGHWSLFSYLSGILTTAWNIVVVTVYGTEEENMSREAT